MFHSKTVALPPRLARIFDMLLDGMPLEQIAVRGRMSERQDAQFRKHHSASKPATPRSLAEAKRLEVEEKLKDYRFFFDPGLTR